MERHCRKSNISNVKKRLEMKINQHKMLMNTLHEAFRRPSATEYTLNTIKSAINDTLEEIADLRGQINSENKFNESLFDGIKKKEETPTKENKMKVHETASFFGKIQMKEKELEEK
jgi:hypothetical protein